MTWAYAPGSRISTVTDYNGLAKDDVNANVCVDMFLSSNKNDATSTTKSTHEVMVWLGRFGAATDPLGFDLGVLDTRIVNGTTL